MRTCAFGGYLVCVLWAGIHTHQDLAQDDPGRAE